MLTAFEGKVTNLVSLSATAPQGPPPPPLVKLTVQVLEMQRDETEKLGVDWADSVTFTETTFSAAAAVGPSLWKRAEDAFRIALEDEVHARIAEVADAVEEDDGVIHASRV